MSGINIAAACIITVMAEYAIFYAFGYMRNKDFALLCASANVATNLSLNLFLAYVGSYTPALLIVSELIVFAAEYVIYALFLGGGKRLLAVTLTANAATFVIGIIL